MFYFFSLQINLDSLTKVVELTYTCGVYVVSYGELLLSGVLVDTAVCHEIARGTFVRAFHAGQHMPWGFRVSTKATVALGRSF